MTKGWSIGSLVLSKRFMISSLLRFIGGFAEAELCPLIFLGRLIFAVVAAAAAAAT